MPDEQSRLERKGAAPTRKRRARASDADAEVNPPGEPSQRRAAPDWERRSKEMPGRQGTMKTHPWETDQSVTRRIDDGDDDDDFDDDEDDFPHPGGPPGPKARNEPV